MIDFKYSAKQKVHAGKKQRTMDSLATVATRDMLTIMKEALPRIVRESLKRGKFQDVPIDELDGVGERFYRKTITAAYHSAETEAEKPDAPAKAKLEAGLPVGLPRTLPGLEKLFRDRRFWPLIMKRSKKLVDRIRKSYLEKLRVRFNLIMPRILDGTMSPKEVEVKLQEGWSASAPRVRNIFRTESTKYFTEVQVRFFADDADIIGFLFDADIDRATTKICRSRHGLIFKPGTASLAKSTPPCHYNCRSHLIPLANTERNRKMVREPSRDPAKRHLEPLLPGWRT
jgi:SPP1 gp7 family putative phage head morphogenesis protein